ncbi:hypothetical protein LTR64_003074 [Lithohypha guttulata]|uniref:uncharacterized protein n=1 Tax=Lithohypha guttulata TaxID=1690604 RepID=UPI00315CD77D
MVVPLLAEGFGRGISNIPHLFTIAKSTAIIGVVYVLKTYFGGAKCLSERNMHGKVVVITGGASGIGAQTTKELASRGAQIILLTHHEPSDPFLVDYIDDLRTQCNNELIYAEQVDLSSLHSIRMFATKWVDNAPPRRLDTIVLCANVMTPKWGKSRTTVDGVEEEWMVNYLSTYHLLSILSPAIRAQPPDRDVRILFSTCSSYIGGTLDLSNTETKAKSGSWAHSRTKLAVMNFAHAFQKHLDAYERPDKQPGNARALVVDPGYSRTPGMRRWLTGGSLIGLLLYLLTWPIWWLILKSPVQGAQSFLFAVMDPQYGQGLGGKYIKECREIEPLRPEVRDEVIAGTLWEFSEKQIERLEKQGAVQRALEKKEKENAAKQGVKTTDAGSNGTANGNTGDASHKQQTAGSRRNKKQKS